MKANLVLRRESFLAMIRNAVGANVYRTLYIRDERGKRDVLEDGDLSCAYFASSVLHQFKLIESPHATVAGTVRDLEASGWQKVETPQAGDVLVWEKQEQGRSGAHTHIGFSVGGERAVSNDSFARVPQEHHLTFGEKDGAPARRITALYRFPNL